MYLVQEHPDLEITLEGGSLVHPICTLADEHGGRAQIVEDDHCLVLCLCQRGTAGTGLERYRPTAWWFKEAVEAVRRLEGVWPPLQYAPGSPSADTESTGRG